MPELTTVATNSCDQCGKPQEELQEPLKRCARCGGQKYCSKGTVISLLLPNATFLLLPRSDPFSTQNAKNWTGVTTVKSAATQTPSSTLTKSDIVRHAMQTVELMEALASIPEFSQPEAKLNAPALLRDTYNFLATTLHDYFGELLQPQMTVDLTCRVAIGPDVEQVRAEMLARFDELVRETGGGFDRKRWPPFDREKFTDGISRNLTACLMITDEPRAREMYKKDPASQTWTFGESVKAVAWGILGKDVEGGE